MVCLEIWFSLKCEQGAGFLPPALGQKMRKRKIRKIGNSYYVKLEQVDLTDWEVEEGDLVGVEPLGDKKDA